MTAHKPKALATIIVMTDGTLREKGVNGPNLGWQAAHTMVTNARKHNQKVRATQAAAKRAESKAKNAPKVKAQIAAVEARLAKLKAA